MKGIVLAGGTGSRLFPLTKVTNKHLLPVGYAPMIWHPVWKLKQAGLDEIMIVTGTEHMGDVVGSLGSGKRKNAGRSGVDGVLDQLLHDRSRPLDHLSSGYAVRCVFVENDYPVGAYVSVWHSL